MITWTDEQKAAIAFPCHKDGTKLAPDKRSATVTAAAGSGKTALLVERVIRILCDEENPVNADEIAVMTFTRNAAEEFRRRMTDAVAAASRKDPKNAYLAEQLIRFKSAPITTINAFCLDILREHAEGFGLPLSFSVIDEARAALLKASALDETMEFFYSQQLDTDSRDLLFNTFSFQDDVQLTEAIGEIHSKVTSLIDYDKWLDACVDSYADLAGAERCFLPVYIEGISRSLKCCHSYLDSYALLIRRLPDDHTDKPALLKMLIDDEDKLAQADKAVSRITCVKTVRRLKKLLAPAVIDKTNKFKNLTCKDEHLKEMIKPLRESFKDSYKQLSAAVPDADMIIAELPSQHNAIGTLVKLIKLYDSSYTRLKREGGYIDFSDCEQLLLNKLREDSVFRRELSSRYRCIIVDEFQDTNDIQHEIFRLISDNENNLFFVGDIKQAIYAFRGGNPRIMLSLCDPMLDPKRLRLPMGALNALRQRKPKLPTARKIKSGCRVFALGKKHTALPLNMNFRSRQQVIDTVNAMFTGLMTKEYGDVDYNSSTMLVRGASFPESASDYTSELHLLDYTDEKDKASAEARYTAALVNRMLQEGFRVKKDEKSTRPCRYGDFCILLRSKTSFSLYKQQLQLYGIPVDLESGRNYLASEEITLILDYLKVIDNPMRDEELLKLLMSPICMMSAEELAQARLGILGIDKRHADDPLLSYLYERYKDASLFGCISACAKPITADIFRYSKDKPSEDEMEKLCSLRTQGHPKCADFIQTLTQFRELKANSSIERLIRKIYDNTDFFSVISTYERGEQRLANIRLLLKYAADFESSGGGTLSDFLRYTDRVRDRDESFAEAATAESAENSVRLMTFHASKGLEMPVVILAELGSSTNKSDSSGAMVFNRNVGIGLRYVDVRARYHYKPFGYNAIADAERQKQKGEELRLLYVAMTRAREKLIMIGRCKTDSIDRLRTESFTPDFAMSQSGRLDWILASLLRYSGGAVITDTPKEFQDGVVRAHICCTVPDDPDATEAVSPEKPALPDEKTAQSIASAILTEYSHHKDTTARSKFSVTEIAHMIDVQDKNRTFFVQVDRPSFMPQSRITGKRVGDAYHHAMEHYPLTDLTGGKNADPMTVAKTLFDLNKRNLLLDEELKLINPAHVAAFFNSELGKRMLCAERIEREYPIFAEVPASSIYVQQEGNTIIQGRADMFFVENNEIVLIDYKSDSRANLEKELKAYSRQLNIYRSILHKLTGMRVKEIYIYSFSCDATVAVEDTGENKE